MWSLAGTQLLSLGTWREPWTEREGSRRIRLPKTKERGSASLWLPAQGTGVKETQISPYTCGCGCNSHSLRKCVVKERGSKCILASKRICILETSPSTTDDPRAWGLSICMGLPTSCTGRTPKNSLDAFNPHIGDHRLSFLEDENKLVAGRVLGGASLAPS